MSIEGPRSYPPPRPGYHRDADPEGDYSADYTPLGDEVELTVLHEWNVPLILTVIGLVLFGLPISLILWEAALSWL